ncbi:MAG: deoxyribonuclease IV [Parachlamydiaceae bacterium]|nr:deoxyribonuclease IV [Parachlamydiaceae bacterium]
MTISKTKEVLLGAHTSAAGGAYNALIEGKRIGATTVQLFTANQKRWNAKALDEASIEKWNEALAETGLKHIMSHDSYLINLGAPNPENLEKSLKAFREEVIRCNQLGITYLNFHPGAALTDDPQACMDRIVNSILSMEDVVAKGKTRLLLEATAGQGSAIGCRFEQLAYILHKVEKRVPIGVCIDTCHIFVAGYDIRTAEAWDMTLKEFDRIAGLKHLYAFHVNDTTKDIGSRVDRHAPLGEGKIGMECFRFLMQDPRVSALPKYLETPGGPELWDKEIRMLREFL